MTDGPRFKSPGGPISHLEQLIVGVAPSPSLFAMSSQESHISTQSVFQSIAPNSVDVGVVCYYLRASVSESTKRAYQHDFDAFLRWGGDVPSTPEVVAAYIASLAATHSPFTIARRLVAITHAHRAGRHVNPCEDELVRSTLAGIRRVHGTAQRQVSALVREDLFALLEQVPSNSKGIRDRALLLVGFAGAFRRTELIGLDLRDIAHVPEGLVVTLRRCKTDQEGEGRKIGIPFARSKACPVKAMADWIEHAKIESGPIFRKIKKGGRIGEARVTGQSVALIVKHYAELASLDPKLYSGHSLRAGLVTSAAKLGVSTWKIRQQTGHRSEAMLFRYIRDANLFVDNASGIVL